MRTIFRICVTLALVAACAEWALSRGLLLAKDSTGARASYRLWGNGRNLSMKQGWRAVPSWDAELADMRRAVSTFEAREYMPPVWALNAHFHTIVASGDLEKRLLGNRTPWEYWRERWPTPDGDFVDIDWLPAEDPHGLGLEREVQEMDELDKATSFIEGSRNGSLATGCPDQEASARVPAEQAPWIKSRRAEGSEAGSRRPRRLVILLHGLESSSTAPLTQRFSTVYSRNGFDVAAVNFRGCGGELGKYPVGYHLGFTADLLHVIKEVHLRFPGTWDRLYLSGFSLGGNVIVKFLGEQGDAARDLGIYGASVCCVPFEPQLGAEKLNKNPLGRYVYMPTFLAWLNVKAMAHARAYPEVLSLEDVHGVKTFGDFDTYVTLPIFGFSSKEEYYSHVNAANYLSRVRVPLLVINARDDPFIDGDALPGEEKAGDAPVRLVYHDHGGHCGFMDGLLYTMWKHSRTRFLMRRRPQRGRERPGWSPRSGASRIGTWSTRAGRVAASAASRLEAEISNSAAMVTSSLQGEVADVGGDRDDRSKHGIGSGRGGLVPQGKAGDENTPLDTTSVRILEEGRWLPTELARFVEHLDRSLHAGGRSQRPRSSQSPGGSR